MKKNNFYKNKERGSFLFLAMVIMSIVLATGIGGATILVRQLRKMNETEKAAVAFYVAETGLDKVLNDATFEKGEWVDINREEVNRELKYMVEDGESGEYKVTVMVDNRYYVFNKTSEEGGGGEEEESGTITIYYSHPKEKWENVIVRYYKYKDGVAIGSFTEISMIPSGYTNWVKYNIEGIEENIDELRFRFKEGNVWSNIYYIYKKNGAFPSSVSFSPITFSVCEVDNGDFTLYYSNPNKWGNVDILYYKYSGGVVYNYGIPSGGQMISSGHNGWKKYTSNTDPAVDELRIGFGERGKLITDYVYYIYKNDVFPNCFSSAPGTFYLFLED